MDPAKSKLTRNILIGLVLGMVCGLVLGQIVSFQTDANGAFLLNEKGQKILAEGFAETYVVQGALELMGQVFIRALTLIVAPLVFVSLVCGTAAMDDMRKLGSIGLKTFGVYVLTTAAAISLGILLATLFKPGAGLDIPAVAYTPSEPKSTLQVLIEIVPNNFFSALVRVDMLQIIFAAMLCGVAIVAAGEAGRPAQRLFESLNEVVMKAVTLLMYYAPIGVFAKIAQVFATEGFDTILALFKYFALVFVTLLLHGLIFYPALLKVVGRLDPIIFMRKFRETQMFAFSTASSNATIPLTLRALQTRLGVSKKVSAFTIPFGATINMDGTAIMQGVATVFIAQYAGVDLSLGQIVTVIFTATIASIGTAGVPSAGLVMLVIVLNQIGLPVEAIGLIIGIDRLLDMVRTAVNVTGDAAVTCIVAKSENQLDEAVFSDPKA